MLKKCNLLLTSKRQDYTEAENNQFENFERSAQLLEWFKNDRDRAFVALIGTKLARLASLLNKGSEPNHEAIEDTFIDLANYALLWGGKVSKDIQP